MIPDNAFRRAVAIHEGRITIASPLGDVLSPEATDREIAAALNGVVVPMPFGVDTLAAARVSGAYETLETDYRHQGGQK